MINCQMQNKQYIIDSRPLYCSFVFVYDQFPFHYTVISQRLSTNGSFLRTSSLQDTAHNTGYRDLHQTRAFDILSLPLFKSLSFSFFSI